MRRLLEDLNFDTRLVIGETVREPDGLAMSSRNVYLGAAERSAAPAVFAALTSLASAYERGERSTGALRAEVEGVLAREPLLSLEYLSLCSAVDGAEAEGELRAGEATLASIAVKIGATRLIDNVMLRG